MVLADRETLGFPPERLQQPCATLELVVGLDKHVVLLELQFVTILFFLHGGSYRCLDRMCLGEVFPAATTASQRPKRPEISCLMWSIEASSNFMNSTPMPESKSGMPFGFTRTTLP